MENEDVYLYNLDDLAEIAETNLKERKAAISAVKRSPIRNRSLYGRWKAAAWLISNNPIRLAQEDREIHLQALAIWRILKSVPLAYLAFLNQPE